jgi:hypothetical protein
MESIVIIGQKDGELVRLGSTVGPVARQLRRLQKREGTPLEVLAVAMFLEALIKK